MQNLQKLFFFYLEFVRSELIALFREFNEHLFYIMEREFAIFIVQKPVFALIGLNTTYLFADCNLEFLFEFFLYLIITYSTVGVDTVKNFLFELGMKPHMHTLEISIFSLNNVTVRFIKTMNNLLEHLKILIFRVFFSIEIFSKKNL